MVWGKEMLLKRLTMFAVVWTLGLIMLGAWVRLHDAGLGCPDWPGCYGHFSPVHAEERIKAVESLNPNGPITMAKAWKEMIHRYAATFLGLIMVIIMALAWIKRRELTVSPWLPTGLLAVLIFQGLLGMWTVTLLLKPAVVTGHLLGGMATLALLVLLALKLYMPRPAPIDGLRILPMLALVAVAVQIFLGGWTSTNYAALACSDFPACLNGQWLPDMDFGNAFHVTRELGKTAEGDNLPLAALTAIHWLHRLGALVVTLVVGALGLKLLRHPALKAWGLALLLVLALQLALGVANVVYSLPLSIAVAHNGVAALLLMVCVALNYRLWRGRSGECA